MLCQRGMLSKGGGGPREQANGHCGEGARPDTGARQGPGVRDIRDSRDQRDGAGGRTGMPMVRHLPNLWGARQGPGMPMEWEGKILLDLRGGNMI